MARSLLRQLEQIRGSATYADAISGINTSAIAEPTTSGSLEEDLNIIRSLIRQLKGSTNWYDSLGMYFNPSNTNSGGDPLENFNLFTIKNNTLDSKSIIIGVYDDNSGNGYIVSGTSTGILMNITTKYAGSGGGIDRTGIPIFASTAHSGQYYDLSGNNNVCKIDIAGGNDLQEIKDYLGRSIFAKFHDGCDFGGMGEGHDVYANFYYDDGDAGTACDLSTVSGLASTVVFIYPQRKRLSDIAEYEWQRNTFTSSESNVSSVSSQKYVESVTSEITQNIIHYWPSEWNLTYTPNSTSGQEGSNVDIYLDGQLLAADTGNGGVNADRDYAEEAGPTTTASGFTFRFTIQSGRNITYIVRN